jgi:nucleotide-binding universal stress UspA family protein
MFEKILLAVDSSDYSRRAVDVALGLAGRFGGEVLVFHVREWTVSAAGAFPTDGMAAVDLEREQEADALVRGVVRTLEDGGVKATAEVRSASRGQVAGQILEEAKDVGAGLIVMGTRGLSDLSGLLLGSVAHKVLHLAECPVLITR